MMFMIGSPEPEIARAHVIRQGEGLRRDGGIALAVDGGAPKSAEGPRAAAQKRVVIPQQISRGVPPIFASKVLDVSIERGQLIPPLMHDACAAAFHLVKSRFVIKFPYG